MKKLILYLNFMTVTLLSLAQSRNCPMSINLNAMRTQDRARYQRFINLENFTTNFINNRSKASYRLADPNGVIIIPVVVHILHRNEAVGTGLNISLAQIQSQIDVLNEDFRRLNADRINTPGAFTGVASDYNFEFRLACQDPNGNATNGVTRRFTNRTGFNFSANTNGTANDNSIGIKFTSSGGEDAWPTNRYLNIWVGNFTDNTLGYATWPADFAASPNVDGVVISTTAMGRVGNVAAPFNGGRTATHEIGHWLNLRHIWGDSNCGDDLVADTPTQQTSNFGCPGFPHRTCGNTTNGDMFMNYMDYTNDNCMNIFTNGQRTRGRALFAAGGARAVFIDNYFQLQQTGPICSIGTLNLRNPNCLQPTWSVVSGTATITPVGTNQATITSTVAGSVTVRATAGNYTSETTFNITVGNPTPAGSSSVNSNCSGNSFNVLNTSLSGICSANAAVYFAFNITDPNYSNFVYTPVSLPSGASWSGGGRSLNLTVYTPPSSGSRTATIALRATGPCGPYNVNFNATAVNISSGWRFSMSPNPSDGQVTVSTDSESLSDKESQNLIHAIKVTDRSGTRSESFEYKGGINLTTISLKDCQPGLYILSVFDGKTWSSKQLLIRK